jgi:hypothetical protein
VPGPAGERAGRTLVQRFWLWLGGLAGVLLVCCGLPRLTSSVLTGSVRSLITVPLLGLVLALTIVDKVALTGRTAAPVTWHCWRCGHTWLSELEPVPPKGSRSPLAAAALRTAKVARMILLPWKPAAFLFAPRHRLAPEDRVVAALGRTRVVLGLAIVVGVALWYRNYGQLELSTFIEGWLVTGLLAIPSCLICMGLLVALTRAGRRHATIRQMKWPALSLAAFVATMALLALFGAGANYVSGRIDYYTGGAGIPLDELAYGGVFGVWLLIFCLRGTYLVTQNWFNAVDGHLLLPPVIGTWMAWLVVAKSLIFQDGPGGVPETVSLVLILGGATATTGIAALEGWRATRRYGVTLRDGPGPARTGQAAPGGTMTPVQ